MKPQGETGRGQRVLVNSAILAVAKLLERMTGFLVALLLAIHLGVEGLGIFATAWAVYGFIAIAGDAGTTNFLIREVSRDRTRTVPYTVHLSLLAVVVATPLMLGAQLLVPHVGYSPEAETSVAIVLLAIFPRVLNGVQEALFITYGKVAFETLTRMVFSLLYLLAVAWVLQDGGGVPAVLRLYVATEYVVAIVYFVLINRYIVRLRIRFRVGLMVRIAREVRAFTASSLLAAFSARPEILILSFMVDERDVGLFSAALRIAELPLLVPEVVMLNVFPLLSEFYRRDEERYAKWQAASIRAMLMFALPLGACFLAVPGPLLTLLFPDEFAAASDLLRCLALNVVCFSVIAVLWRSLVARGRQGTNVAIQSGMIGMRLSLGAATIAMAGPFGAAATAAGASVVHLAVLRIAVARSGAPSRFPLTTWLLLLAAAGMGATVWVIERFMPLPVALSAGILVYLVVAWTTGAITADDRVLLRRLRGNTDLSPTA